MFLTPSLHVCMVTGRRTRISNSVPLNCQLCDLWNTHCCDSDSYCGSDLQIGKWGGAWRSLQMLWSRGRLKQKRLLILILWVSKWVQPMILIHLAVWHGRSEQSFSLETTPCLKLQETLNHGHCHVQPSLRKKERRRSYMHVLTIEKDGWRLDACYKSQIWWSIVAIATFIKNENSSSMLFFRNVCVCLLCNCVIYTAFQALYEVGVCCNEYSLLAVACFRIPISS